MTWSTSTSNRAGLSDNGPPEGLAFVTNRRRMRPICIQGAGLAAGEGAAQPPFNKQSLVTGQVFPFVRGMIWHLTGSIR